MNSITNIREALSLDYAHERFIIDKSGVKTVEIIGASFIADEPYIFGAVNQNYAQRELAWYDSQSRSVNDFPGGAPKIWREVADNSGIINSNYGWCIYSDDNWNQYSKCLTELLQKPNSRRAVMIYIRPSMHVEYGLNGRSDFICTSTVQFLIRNGKLNCVVNMRSQDAWAGYRNDYHWQKTVLDRLLTDVNNGRRRRSCEPLIVGSIVWQVGSLHLYGSQFYLLEHFLRTGEAHITRDDFREIYGR